MRFLLPLLLLLSALTTTVLLPGCEPKEDLITTDSSARLEFSLDTVKFDTVFVATGTVTKRLWVYNRNARAVRVAEISLQSRPAVTYNLLINGDAGPSARNVEIRGKDSLLVLVRATIDPTPADGKPFLVEDDLRFVTNGNAQAVKVLSYGQNAYFHDAETITSNTVWKADKPHVIYNSVLVKPGITLTIAAGARIYSHFRSYLVVKGRLLCNPDYQPTGPIKPTDPNIVRFQGDRREAEYAERPGQWGGIEFDLGSQGNVLRYTEIKNSTLGIYLFNPFDEQPRPQVRIENVELRNISTLNSGLGFDGAALLSLSGDLTASNTLISNCEQYAVYAVQSSQVRLDYCTIANYSLGTRDQPSVLISPRAPFETINDQPLPAVAPRGLTVRNSIIWGSIRDGDELEFVAGEQYAGNISIRNSLLKTKKYDNTGPLGQQKNGNVLNPDEFAASIFKSTPLRFRGTSLSFELDSLSSASNRALPLLGLPTDLLNRPRNPTTPDIGAYERVNP
ncbi:hypothetical protein D0N36_01375 [Hymenobacter lapidiphilus]|uniref:right-handed parallel beta-helix repeat-containing protein n=1 Tax=Hymenobacter sp. CCM 8763 TaxID=2303334 RepID=UPI000E346284|nr:right-handed parallel beta-helix repeat-containing protein [Hymenobacter sp. CCM 8763]RFP66762.1 hypothetical protein D0N36_01375 [Hymenobacter sp. CCM 8763]